MPGAFVRCVEEYALRGVSIVPTMPDQCQKPAIKGPGKIGVRAARQLAHNPRFQDANAALWCGPRNGIAIADVDTTDERVWQRVIDLLGDTPIKVRSGGGNLHLWFGYNGERRSVRAIPELELDILGNGIAVVPPSINVAKGGLRVYPGWPRGNSSTPLHAVNLAA